MKTLHLEKDIPVFFITASAFPEGVLKAHQSLHALVPFSKERSYFGLSRPENGGEIVYRAAAEEIREGEAKEYGCETLLIKKGIYCFKIVKNFRENPHQLAQVFKELLATPHLDPQGYCVEWYANDQESVTCMVPLRS